MVRAVDSDLFFLSSKTQGEAYVFECNDDIPGLRTKGTVLKNLYLDEVNLTAVNLHLPQRAQPSVKEYCYAVSGFKSLCQLGEEVASRLKLCSCYIVQFSFDSVVLSEGERHLITTAFVTQLNISVDSTMLLDTKVSTLYKEYQSVDGFLDLSCDIVPKLPTVAPYKEYRKTCKTCYFNVYHKAKVPIIAPVHDVTEEVPFPPYTICTRRQVKKASMIRKGGSFGSGKIVYGSYGAGDLQFFGTYGDYDC
ncbi:uncharacterized protein LOC119325153 [Triticum dicoccoides]|uniref:uncharacterized protein LOC119325153 n=1 Tax=Triticum dicoccoides TaxID=85692 RepID=UPI000E7981F2|nr:uncharacterized protein LOC119325153 [Triticum dicoccoides]